MTDRVAPELPPVAPTGIAGLDAILHGGLPREEMHMLQGTAGTGKTTAALQFLREGVRLGEASLYVTLSQSKPHLERIARSHGWSVEGITVHELSPNTVAERIASRQTLLPTHEVELEQIFDDLQQLIRQTKPRRAVIDSLTILQLLIGGSQRYHQEVVALRHLFTEHGCTVLALADHPAEGRSGQSPEVMFHPLCGVVMDLAQDFRPYGDVRRRLRIIKARGLPHDGGHFDFKILTDGMTVYPRLGAYTKAEARQTRTVPSGVQALDDLLGGGMDEGTSGLIIGPSGTGKSTLAAQFATSAAARGEHVAVYLFDERPETFKNRADGIGLPMRQHVEAGRIHLAQLDPAEIAPGEFAQQVRQWVEDENVKLIVIDSIAGYFTAVGSSDLFIAQLHELLTYLSRSGVLTLLIGSKEGFMSIGHQQGLDISYLSDTILLLGYYETDGDLHRYVTAVKRRQGEHRTSIHTLTIGRDGVGLGPPLRHLDDIILHNARPDRNGGDRE